MAKFTVMNLLLKFKCCIRRLMVLKEVTIDFYDSIYMCVHCMKKPK